MGFRFVFLTDTHIQPELGAAAGVRKAFDAVRALRPDFVLVGGDIVMDAAFVDQRRADDQFALWTEASARLSCPVHCTIGNHDLYAIGGDKLRSSSDPERGKGLWQKRLGIENRYGTFDHKGWRIVRLDSCGITPEGGWEGVLDQEQLTWLDNLLRKTPKTMPLVFLTHFPLMTAFGLYTEGTTNALGPGMIVKNGKAFHELIQGHTNCTIFQGHTHVVEEVKYVGARYITGGAVCGDWWKGKRLGVHPEGFLVAETRGRELSWRYQPYGWNPIKA
jgi:3',5'-cyclic-AMP phosphodiesterase